MAKILTLDEVKRQYVTATLAYFHGRKDLTARALAINRWTLTTMLRRWYGDDLPAEARPSDRRLRGPLPP